MIWITETCREVRTSTGSLLYYEGTVEDITLRKRREEELRAAKEAAETANRAKTEFLATMSHELRTPLNAVMGFAEIIHKETMGAVGVPAYRDYAGNIHASGQHLLAVINDILDFVKAESGSLAARHRDRRSRRPGRRRDPARSRTRPGKPASRSLKKRPEARCRARATSDGCARC